MPKNYFITIPKPNISSTSRTSGVNQTTTTIYNDSSVTYNSSSQVYGGFAGGQDNPPSNEPFINFIPKNKNIINL